MTDVRPEMVRQEEIDRVWGSANFGDKYSRMEIVKFAVLKCAAGYHQGHTSRQIATELGLVSVSYKLTKRGRFCLWIWFGDNESV